MKYRTSSIVAAWLVSLLLAVDSFAQEAKPPVRFAMVGLSHDHAKDLNRASPDGRMCNWSASWKCAPRMAWT